MSEGQHDWTSGQALPNIGRTRPAPVTPLTEPTIGPIEGPSAFGRDWKRFRNLLWLSAQQEFRLQYRTSALGYVWTLLRPLALFAVLYFIFTEIVRFGAGIENYPLLLLLGIVFFQFFVDATSASMSGLVRAEGLVRKMHFPRMVVPLSLVLVAGMTGLMNLAAALVFVLLFGGEFHTSWLLLPIPLLALTVFTTGVSLLLGTAFVWIRDIGQIWGVIVRALFYMTPIIYPLTAVPERFHTLVVLNPLAPIITEAKNLIVDPGAPGVVDTVGWAAFAGSAAIAVVLCIAGFVLFVRRAPYIAERL